MFTQLVESKPAAKKGGAGTVVSFIAHYGVILVVLYTSAEARAVNGRPKEEKINFIQPKEAEEPPKPVTNAQGQRTGTLINVVA